MCEPASELHIAEDWYRRTALDDLLGVPAERINDDRLYRALDRLLPHKQALETHLKERLGALFDLDYELLLYDVTSTYFEGQAEGNGLARRGYSRDHRGDCMQVCIGLVVTRDGVPLGYEVFAGNRTDVTTVEEIVTTKERRYGQARRVWVMDRGMASAENIAWLRGSQRLYVIGASKSELKKFAGPLADRRDWQQVRDGVEAKVCAGPDGSETFLLVRSAERQQKEQAMHARFCERIETALASLQRRIERAQKPIDRGAAERQIGRLLGRNARAAARYAIRLVDDQILPAGLRLEWSRRAEWDDWSRHSECCYVLRTNLRDWMGASVRRLRQAANAIAVTHSPIASTAIIQTKKNRWKPMPLYASAIRSIGTSSSAAPFSSAAHPTTVTTTGSAPPLQTLWPSTTARPAAVATMPENSIHGPLHAISSSVARVLSGLVSMPTEIATR